MGENLAGCSWHDGLHYGRGQRRRLRHGKSIQRNDFYIFSHPEFKDELRAIFEDSLNALPDEQAPPARLAFEESRRAAAAEARKAWPKL